MKLFHLLLAVSVFLSNNTTAQVADEKSMEFEFEKMDYEPFMQPLKDQGFIIYRVIEDLDGGEIEMAM